MWSINEHFLKNMINQNKTFILSHDPQKAIAGTSFYKEIQYLKNNGITNFFKDGTIWAATTN